MNGDLVIQEGGQSALTEGPSESSGLLQSIIEASRDPKVDAAKLEAMTNLALRLRDDEQKQQFNRDLNAAISEMPVITKAGRIVIADKISGAVIQSTAYERFEDLDRMIKPIARRHNIQYNFDVGGDDKRLLVTIILRHANGYVERSSPIPLPLETSGSKNNVQGVGSSNTYGKRYALKNAFAISVEGEDDDANGGKMLMPQERGNLVIEEAAAAFDDGRYQEWYWAQSPKDRGWLVQSGHHARFGGIALLGPLEAKIQVGSRPKDPPTDDRPKSQLEQRIDQYAEKVRAASTLELLAAVQEEHREWIDKVREQRPAVGERLIAINSERFAELSADAGAPDRNQNDSAGDLFNEELN